MFVAWKILRDDEFCARRRPGLLKYDFVFVFNFHTRHERVLNNPGKTTRTKIRRRRNHKQKTHTSRRYLYAAHARETGRTNRTDGRTDEGRDVRPIGQCATAGSRGDTTVVGLCQRARGGYGCDVGGGGGGWRRFARVFRRTPILTEDCAVWGGGGGAGRGFGTRRPQGRGVGGGGVRRVITKRFSTAI